MEKVKRMKKFNAIVCILTLLCALVVPSSVSASAGESSVEVVCSDEFSVVNKLGRAIPGLEGVVAPNKELALGVSNTVMLNSKSNLSPYSYFQSDASYTTNTTKIYLRMKSNIKNPLRITIYKRNGKPIGQTVINVPATVTFTNLMADEGYYFSFENVGTVTVDITGTVAPK